MKTKFYIILLNYNGYLDTIECLESIFKETYDNFQIIVIDNSETDRDISRIENWANGKQENDINTNFPLIIFSLIEKPINYAIVSEDDFLSKENPRKLILVKAKSNNGFAAGNNIALEYIKKFGDNDALVWLLNNDTIVSTNILNNLLFEIGQYVGDINLTLFGTPLLEYYDSKKIQAIGGKYNKFFALTKHIGEGMILDKNLDVNQFYVDYPIGASMIVTNKYLKTVGLLSEDYFLYFEELDWALRLKSKGGKVKILNVFGVYHKQGSSTKMKTAGLKNEFIDLLSIKNRILFTKKFYKNCIISVSVFLLIITVTKRVVSGNFERAFKIIKTVFRQGV